MDLDAIAQSSCRRMTLVAVVFNTEKVWNLLECRNCGIGIQRSCQMKILPFVLWEQFHHLTMIV
jgi:hypothetical protein